LAPSMAVLSLIGQPGEKKPPGLRPGGWGRIRFLRYMRRSTLPASGRKKPKK
jgi:hypothetical protein